MLAYVIRRCFYIVPTVLLISMIAFAIIQAPPGDFLTTRVRQLRRQYGKAADERIEALRKRYGLGKPIYEQYYKWIEGIILHLDLGYSFSRERPVREVVAERIPPTVFITFLTLIFTWAVAIPIGVYSAIKKHTLFDYIFTFIAFIGRSIPNFLLALVGMYVLYVGLGWHAGGLFSQVFVGEPWSWAKFLNLLKHLPLPIFVIGTAGTAGLVRILRGMMLDELGKQYIQTARAKGISERVIIWKHAFRISVLPLISTIGWLLPRLVGGAMITSIVLNLPTTGTALFNALRNEDMYVAGSFILILSTLTIIGTLVSDIALAQLDPRIRYD